MALLCFVLQPGVKSVSQVVLWTRGAVDVIGLKDWLKRSKTWRLRLSKQVDSTGN
ncbi:unnamed protein product [Dovyalis caffra]|uniref:Uncharacterized protein n=1 Tax=Dovyalis caffra TaxID=77055 RepID=A0AAV1RJI5_9ROSI|nr:unnamed protein product [Dovyalis caffra]